MLAPLGVPGGYEILGTMAAYAEMIGGVLIVNWSIYTSWIFGTVWYISSGHNIKS